MRRISYGNDITLILVGTPQDYIEPTCSNKKLKVLPYGSF
ncbi:hypothetical protein THZB04_20631 [Vibrio owensii]|nr:hypothetical protein THZB04_20631 [Vibrio owensii]